MCGFSAPNAVIFRAYFKRRSFGEFKSERGGGAGSARERARGSFHVVATGRRGIQQDFQKLINRFGVVGLLAGVVFAALRLGFIFVHNRRVSRACSPSRLNLVDLERPAGLNIVKAS